MKSTTLPEGSTETQTFINKLKSYALTEEEKENTLNTDLETWVTDTTTYYPILSYLTQTQ